MKTITKIPNRKFQKTITTDCERYHSGVRVRISDSTHVRDRGKSDLDCPRRILIDFDHD